MSSSHHRPASIPACQMMFTVNIIWHAGYPYRLSSGCKEDARKLGTPGDLSTVAERPGPRDGTARPETSGDMGEEMTVRGVLAPPGGSTRTRTSGAAIIWCGGRDCERCAVADKDLADIDRADPHPSGATLRVRPSGVCGPSCRSRSKR
mmetsp:Transcript_27703/g.62782  ORF Transcript_27703/g.62782 Transcript_27703/m.62782 type:complete len:149 (+) Transcript_27703:261-707(+)